MIFFNSRIILKNFYQVTENIPVPLFHAFESTHAEDFLQKNTKQPKYTKKITFLKAKIAGEKFLKTPTTNTTALLKNAKFACANTGEIATETRRQREKERREVNWQAYNRIE